MAALASRLRAARACTTCHGRQVTHITRVRAIPCADCLGTGTYTDPQIVALVTELRHEISVLHHQLDEREPVTTGRDHL